MADDTIEKDELIEDLAGSGDQSEAEEAIDLAAEENGFGDAPFSQDDAIDILETIADSDDVGMMISVNANTAVAQYRLG
jgi:hypothetical protein